MLSGRVNGVSLTSFLSVCLCLGFSSLSFYIVDTSPVGARPVSINRRGLLHVYTDSVVVRSDSMLTTDRGGSRYFDAVVLTSSLCVCVCVSSMSDSAGKHPRLERLSLPRSVEFTGAFLR